jgi:hypothetical protein
MNASKRYSNSKHQRMTGECRSREKPTRFIDKSAAQAWKGNFQVKITGLKAKIVGPADGAGIVCQARGLAR